MRELSEKLLLDKKETRLANVKWMILWELNGQSGLPPFCADPTDNRQLVSLMAKRIEV